MDILSIFYENIIKEAQTGRINSYFYYNIIFSTKIVEENIDYKANNNDSNVIIPVLIINNKKEFDKLLVEYVNLCMDFYDDSNFEEDILNYKEYDEKDKICKEKTILTLLFANATMDDFKNPIEFLKRRIDFINMTSSKKYDLGYSDTLNANLSVEIKKDIINNETPYQFILKGIDNDGYEYTFPHIKFGISNNKAYIYAIQHSKKDCLDSKKIKRALYKVGEGFSEVEDNYDIYEEGNLKDITASFLVAANICMSYFDKQGIDEMIISPFMIERWDSKKIVNQIKLSRNKITLEQMNELYDEQDKIQSNLTEKFLRTYLRLNHHYENLNINSYPFDIDSNLHISINDNIKCNNKLLLETNILMKEALEQKINNIK